MHTARDLRVYIFGRGERATYKLPKMFRSGTCVLNLDMVYEDQVDRLSLIQVREAALDLALRCTSGHLFNSGGILAVEPNNILYITIFGTTRMAIS